MKKNTQQTVSIESLTSYVGFLAVLCVFVGVASAYDQFDHPAAPPIFSPYCGDGIKSAGEQCDDGNVVRGDGCNFCKLEDCSETDSGKDFFHKGETSYKGTVLEADSCFCPHATESNLYEPCSDGPYLSEMYCDRFGKPVHAMEEEKALVRCPYGCSSGTCNPNPNQTAVFNAAQKDTFDVTEYRTEHYITPKHAMMIDSIQPALLYCEAPCKYTVTIYDEGRIIGESSAEGNHAKLLTARFQSTVVLNPHKRYRMYQHVISKATMTVATAGDIRDDGKMVNADLQQIYSKTDDTYYPHLGPISHVLFGACEDCVHIRDPELRASAPEALYNDVPVATHLDSALRFLLRNGSIDWKEGMSFYPERPVSRAETLKMILRTRHGDIPAMQHEELFTDVSHQAWFAPFVYFGVDAGIVFRNPERLFFPDRGVNTAEFLKLLSKTFGVSTSIQHHYRDIEPGTWFAEFAGLAEQYTLFPDRHPRVLEAERQLTRGEVAIALYQLLAEK